MFNGDTLLATVDQQLASGVATGTAKTRYVHPDHLGSTNVVTDENDGLVQTLDYYPYGATRVSVSTSTNEKRKYIDQFSDDSGLCYLNARYYDSARGQFMSQDPVFWEIGRTQDGRKALANPQYANAYAYSSDNPITKSDPSGRQTPYLDAAEELSSSAPSWGSSISSTLSTWSGSIVAGTGAAIIYISSGYNDVSQKVQNYNNNRNRGTRFVPFSDQGREVIPPGPPDPVNPWDGGPINWKTVGTGLIMEIAAKYLEAKDLPSNGQGSGKWTPLPNIPIQGTGMQGQSMGSRSSSSYNAQIASIQAQINQIQSQVNAIAQSKGNNTR